MGFQIKELDITKSPADAIVNSLGTKTTVYGRICTNIIAASGSKELEDKIAGFDGKVKAGDIEITKSYGLPAKHIIHIVTPFFKYDPNLELLENTIVRILIKAREEEYKRILIPLIGVGYNGYPLKYALKMYGELIGTFCSIFKDIDVVLCLAPKKVKENDISDFKEIRKKHINKKEYPYLEERDFVYTKNDFKYAVLHSLDDQFKLIDEDDNLYPGLTRESKKVITRNFSPNDESVSDFSVNASKKSSTKKTNKKAKKLTNPQEIKKTAEKYLKGNKKTVKFDSFPKGMDSITSYVEKYIETKFDEPIERDVVTRYIYNIITSSAQGCASMKSKHSDKDKRETTSKLILMRYVLGLYMSMNEATDFLAFCGKALSPINEQDMFFKKCIQLKKYGRDNANSFCLENDLDYTIFTYTGETDEYIL